MTFGLTRPSIAAYSRTGAASGVAAVMRIKPHHIVVALGVAIALFTALSGIVAGVTGFHSDSPVTREVFGNIPFLVLLGVTTTLEVDHQLPDGAKFLHGDVYRAYSAVGDAAGAVFVIGMLWAILRRFGPPMWSPYRSQSSKPSAAALRTACIRSSTPSSFHSLANSRNIERRE